jgi:hypothetical protein
LSQREQAVRAVTGLTGVLLLSGDRAPALSADFGRRLRRMADAFAAPAASAAEPVEAQPVAGDENGLRRLFDGHLRGLEALARRAPA